MSLYKKILCGVLASAMTVSMAVPAFAETVTGDITPGTAISAPIATPTIDVTLPTVAFGKGVIFDIYNQLGNGQQVISPNYEFENASVIPVKVNLKNYIVSSSETAVIDATKKTEATVNDGTNARSLMLWMNEAEKDAGTKLYKKDAKGNLVYPTYDQAQHGDKVFATIYEKGNAAITTPVVPGAAYDFSKIARGAAASVDGTGAITATPLDAGITLDRTKTSIRFDGYINKTGAWTATETLTITPVFSIKPQTLEQKDIDEEPAPAATPTITCTTPPTAASITGMGGSLILTVADGGTLKSALTTSDVEIAVKSSGGDVRVITVPGITVSGNNITCKIKGTGVVAGDKITVTLKASAFTETSGFADSAATEFTVG